MSPRPASSPAQPIANYPTISEDFVAVQRAGAGTDITTFLMRFRGDRVPDSVLNELVSDAVILQLHNQAQTLEAPAFPSIAPKDEREGVGLEIPSYVGSWAVQPSDTQNAALAMILVAAGFSGYRPRKWTAASWRTSGIPARLSSPKSARRQPENARI